MATKKISVRLGDLLKNVEKDAENSGISVASQVGKIVAKHYKQPAPSLPQGFAAMPKKKIIDAQLQSRKALARKQKNTLQK